MTATYKKIARRDARLDLEEDNRKELLEMKMKLEVEMLGRRNELMESYRGQLRQKDARIKELESVIAAMMEEIEGLKTGGDN